VTTPNEAIRFAFARHEPGDLDAAEALYAAALNAEPDNLNGLQLLGLLVHRRGHASEAVALLEKAIAALERRGGPTAEHAGLYNNFGMALRAAGRIKEAVANLRRGIALDCGVGALHANLGNALLADGDLQSAIESYETARRLGALQAECSRNLVEAYYRVGRACAKHGDNRGAIEALRRCVEIEGDHAGALFNLGIVLARVGLVDLAAPVLEAAAEVAPQDPDIHGALGNALQARGDPARAYQRASQLGGAAVV
jgi:protein O-GlcNAc transferase